MVEEIHTVVGVISQARTEAVLLRLVRTERATAQHILRKHTDAPSINLMSQLKSVTTLTT